MKFLIFLLLLIFLFAACPPPFYPILFGYAGEWSKSLKIEEDSIKIAINGHITPSHVDDQIFIDIEIEIEGIDTSKIAFYDTTDLNGQLVTEMRYFDDKIIFECEDCRLSHKFNNPSVKGFDFSLIKNKIVAVVGALYDNHKSYDEMTREQFFSYLDSLSGRIRIENIFSESKVIEVKVNKKLLENKLKKYVPALK